MCSNSTPAWSATEAMHNLSHAELRKLGVMMENFNQGFLTIARAAGNQSYRVADYFSETVDVAVPSIY